MSAAGKANSIHVTATIYEVLGDLRAQALDERDKFEHQTRSQPASVRVMTCDSSPSTCSSREVLAYPSSATFPPCSFERVDYLACHRQSFAGAVSESSSQPHDSDTGHATDTSAQGS